MLDKCRSGVGGGDITCEYVNYVCVSYNKGGDVFYGCCCDVVDCSLLVVIFKCIEICNRAVFLCVLCVSLYITNECFLMFMYRICVM